MAPSLNDYSQWVTGVRWMGGAKLICKIYLPIINTYIHNIAPCFKIRYVDSSAPHATFSSIGLRGTYEE